MPRYCGFAGVARSGISPSCGGDQSCPNLAYAFEFFLANCPGVKMDAGGDGVPCERQWCGDR
jgi:hypothetical protein